MPTTIAHNHNKAWADEKADAALLPTPELFKSLCMTGKYDVIAEWIVVYMTCKHPLAQAVLDQT